MRLTHAMVHRPFFLTYYIDSRDRFKYFFSLLHSSIKSLPIDNIEQVISHSCVGKRTLPKAPRKEAA